MVLEKQITLEFYKVVVRFKYIYIIGSFLFNENLKYIVLHMLVKCK